LSDMGSREDDPGVLKNIRRKRAQAILGEPINLARKL
jgi:hypothetical protein